MENIVFKKNIIQFKEIVDFNYLIKLLNENNFGSVITSNYLDQFILNSTFMVSNVQKDNAFIDLYDYLNKNYNSEGYNSNLYMFVSFKMGNPSITHTDDYDVVIIGVHGETVYNLEGTEYRVGVGDLLKIPKGIKHTAISMTPRIVLSYGRYN